MKKLLLITLLALSVTSCGHIDIQKEVNNPALSDPNIVATNPIIIDSMNKQQIVDLSVDVAAVGFIKGRQYQQALDAGQDTTGLTLEDFTNEVALIAKKDLN
jgi:hypothetical protein